MKGEENTVVTVVMGNLIAIIYNEDDLSKEAKACSQPHVKTSLSTFASMLADFD